MKKYFVLIYVLLSIDRIAARCPNPNPNNLTQKTTCNCTQFMTENTNCPEARVHINWNHHPNKDQHWNKGWFDKNRCPEHSNERSMIFYDYYLTCSKDFNVLPEEENPGQVGGNASAHLLLLLGITFVLLSLAIVSVYLQQRRIGKLKKRIHDLETN